MPAQRASQLKLFYPMAGPKRGQKAKVAGAQKREELRLLDLPASIPSPSLHIYHGSWLRSLSWHSSSPSVLSISDVRKLFLIFVTPTQ